MNVDDGYPYDDEEPEVCERCRGEGWYHDCGEDSCACANPEEDDCYICEVCNGKGER